MRSLNRSRRIVCLLLCTLLISSCSIGADTEDQETKRSKLAEERGSGENYIRGKEVLRHLSSLSREEQQKMDIGLHRGERVAFVGSTAPPGATNDLMTKLGFYLRVVNRGGRDLRPHSAVCWEALVCGEVLQVLPENKLIVIEVRDEDWITLETW
jgi:hypothetical protein